VTRLIALALALLLAGCGGDEDDGAASDADANVLEVTRNDGSRVEFSGTVRAWCEDGRVFVLGGRFPKEDEEHPPAFWYLSAAEGQETIELPAENLLFVFDPPVGSSGNELSSNEEESSGSVTFRESGCEQGDTVRVDIDATLDSEYHDLPSARAEGEIESVIGDPIPIPD
jgi:hypothetical protein